MNAHPNPAPRPPNANLPVFKNLGRVDYEPTWRAMQDFTAARGPDTPDEIWFLEHPPVFTLGLNGKPEHVLAAGDIPVVNIDRGGQVTYHGPGQLVVYPLLNIKRHKLGVRCLVEALENAVIDTLADYGINAQSRRDAPGVYTREGAKIAALGLRVKNGCTYHGLAFNIRMDLEPFKRINPCGYTDMKVTQVSDLCGSIPDNQESVAQVAENLKPHLLARLGFNP
ncbi:MAG TPA: lipoyl(octanoyl) transferase LipB [Gammaproteobacteria bacterium]|nr:lipoyl(octanoyl) transferase LipB [Gammaproteobacteria bacterium]